VLGPTPLPLEVGGQRATGCSRFHDRLGRTAAVEVADEIGQALAWLPAASKQVIVEKMNRHGRGVEGCRFGPSFGQQEGADAVTDLVFLAGLKAVQSYAVDSRDGRLLHNFYTQQAVPSRPTA
jgi:hypothetical protein